MLATSNFCLSCSVFKRLLLHTRKNQGLYGKALKQQHSGILLSALNLPSYWINKYTYDEALLAFYNCKSYTARKYLLDCKQIYKDPVRRKKRYFKELQDIEKLKFSKPQNFWKHFRKKKVLHEHSISLDEFFRYFSTLENDISYTVNNKAEDFCKNHNFAFFFLF